MSYDVDTETKIISVASANGEWYAKYSSEDGPLYQMVALWAVVEERSTRGQLLDTFVDGIDHPGEERCGEIGNFAEFVHKSLVPEEYR